MKEYTYQGLRYKRDNNGQWQFFNPTYNTWVYHQYNHPSVDGNHVYDADALEKMYKDKNLKETTTQDIATQQKRSSYNAPKIQNALITTQAKIKQVSNNAPTVENASLLKQLQVQKQKEDEQARKENELEQQEIERGLHLRNVGSDNTRVNINSDAFPKIRTVDEYFQDWNSITKRQKAAASQVVNSGDLAKHFPKLRDQYLSEENSHRSGGPLTMEELALEQIRTNPDFFKTLDDRKFADFKRREQSAYDDMNIFEKGANFITAFAADPIQTPWNLLTKLEGPLAYQASMSLEPEGLGDDYQYYDRMTHKSDGLMSGMNDLINYVNPFRAAVSTGMNLGQGDYGDAAWDAATIIPMLKAAKLGTKGLSALMKVSPATLLNKVGSTALQNSPLLVQNLAKKATVGNLLAGYGGYEATVHNFPNAIGHYSKGEYGKGNEELLMGALMGTPLALEMRGSKIIPRTIQGVKGAYNDVATGDSFMNNYVNAWKNPAASLDAEQSTAMFNKIMQSDNFTSVEKAMLKEYQYSSFPFLKPGPQQDAFNKLISKAELAFPQDAVLTRTFSSPSAFEGVTTNEAGQVTGITNQNRPLSFSAGNTGYAPKDTPTWGKDRIVLSGKNAKKVEGNFIKNRYQPIEEGYYGNIAEEELIVKDFSKQTEIDQSSQVGDNYYGIQRLSPEEVQAQAEAIYNKKAESYLKPSEWDKDLIPEELVGKQRNGPEDVFTLDEATEFAKGHNAARAERLRLYADPANKEEAIQKLIEEAEQSFSQAQGPVNELEVMGSGFDMKVVGKFSNERGGTDYVVQPRNIRPLKKEPNWQKPSEKQLKQEFKVEHELKGNTYFSSENEFMNAIKDAKVEEVTPEMDASISYRSRTDSKEQLVGMNKGYKSWPEFRNEGTIDEIYNGMKSGNKMDMPIVLEFPNGTRRVFSGNTRMDVAFQSGKNPKVLVVKVPDNARVLNSISGATDLSETSGTYGQMRIPYDAEKNKATASIIEELRHDRFLKINSPEGQKRIEELIASNPHLKNMTYDDFKNGFANMVNENAMQSSMEEEFALITQRIKNLESNPNANPLQLDRLKKQASKLEGELLFGEQKMEEKTLNAYMMRLRDRTRNTGSDAEVINMTKAGNPVKYQDASPSDIYSILASPELTADDLARIVEHEFGHYFQQGVKTNLDKMLSEISLKPNSPSLNSNLFSNQRGISNFYNRLMSDSNPFKRMSKYWRTGSKGQEKTAFMEEVRADMLQRGMIDDLYQTITPEILTNHYTKYMAEVGNKYPLRIYEIMQNKSGNFKIMSDVLNKMPGVVPIGIGGAGMMMMQNSEQEQTPENKYGGNIKTLSKFIRK